MSSRNLRIWAVVLLAVGLTAVLATFRDYGITWDEPLQAHYGEGVLRYFSSGLTDNTISDLHHMRFYGPLFELTAALAYADAPGAKYEIRHILIALTGLGAVFGVLGFGTRLPGRWVPFFAPLSLIALPRFYGHAFNNSKDIPFACAFVFAVWAVWRFSTVDRTRYGWEPTLVCGFALGATLAVRPGGLPLLLLLYATGVGWRLLVAKNRDAGLVPEKAVFKEVVIRTAMAWAVAWTLMVALWPWAHSNPLLNPIRAVSATLAFPDAFPVLFEGTVTQSDALPRYYLVKYLAITTPLVLLALAAGGLVVSARELIRRPRTPAAAGVLLVAVWLLAPLTLATITQLNIYDGIRHFLFALPALALIAGIGASAAVDTISVRLTRVGSPDCRFAPAIAAVLALALALPWIDFVRVHPYQSSYFNSLVGGLGGAGGRYEADYWLSSYKEAMEWINARAAESGRPVTVLVAADSHSAECAWNFAGAGVSVAYTSNPRREGEIPERFDYYLSTTRYGLDRSYPESHVAHRVEREGTTLSLIRSRAPFIPEPSDP